MKTNFPTQIFDLMSRRFSLCDIGARDGVGWPWQRRTPKIALVRFEADAEEAARLRLDDSGPVLATALWRTPEALLMHEAVSPGCSSLYAPNLQFLADFPGVNRFMILRKTGVHGDTVDRLWERGELAEIDFAKMDVQGAELAVLKGGRSVFARGLVGLEAEVEFVEVYKGQPLFGEVDEYLRNVIGLELWDFRRTYWKYARGVGYGGAKGRLIHADALYLRPAERIGEWLEGFSPRERQNKVVALCIAAASYGLHDYALHVASRSAEQPLRSALESALTASGRHARRGYTPVYRGLRFLASLFQPTSTGWSVGDDSLGSRPPSGHWL